MITLELCTDSLEGVKAAKRFGLKRVELCAALDVGGLTPNFGLVQSCVAVGGVEIHVMLRPRSGGFVYNHDEMRMMEVDLQRFAKAGVHGVVFGALNQDNEISLFNKTLAIVANGWNMEATFHRAFDMVKDKNAAVEKLIHYGCNRILTSGGAIKAIDGLDVISKLERNYGKKIEILAGSGINPSNVKQFVDAGIKQLHFTARKVVEGNDPFQFGKEYEVDESKIIGIKENLE